ncbi:MAG: beta strand repeat-containing protein, partial [Hyalangium sp.]|uniref:beta strand repeat-containing protein n=1 Tax=Hyalangium sp. TaxID=2028555 RepID=UPI003899A46E
MLRVNVLAVLCVSVVLVSCGSSEHGGGSPVGAAEQELKPVPLAAAFSISTTALAFEDQKTNTSNTMTVRVSNTGNSGNVTITSIAITPTTTQFTVSPSIGSSISSGAHEDYTVTFTPASTGPKAATLTFSYKLTSNGSTLTATVDLTGNGVASAADVSPLSRAFGEGVVNGSGSSKTVTVTNVGTLNSVIQVTPVLTGAGAASYIVSPSVLSVTARGSQDFTVTFVPTAEGSDDATLSFTTDESGSPTVPSVALTGTGVIPVATVASTVAFGEQRVGATSAATMALAVRNDGSGTLHITNAVLSGTDSARYSVSPTTLDVPSGQSLDLTVTFTPTAVGATSATLTLSTDDVDQPTVPVALSGTGVNPTAVVASSVAFGEQSVGATPAPTLSLAVGNSGTGTLHITSAVLSGTDSARYSVSPATLNVPAGQSLNLTVTFTPTALGATSATLTLSTDDVAKPTITVALSGTGVNPTAVVASTVAFGEQSVGATPAPTMALAVRNSGTGTLHITNAVLSGTNSARYSISPATLDVPAGQSLNLTVTFTPVAEGATSATLTLTTNDVAKSTITVALSGTGVNPVATVASTVAFGEQRVGATPAATMPLAVRNDGTGTLHITNAVLSGTDSARYSVSPATLDVPAGQSLNLTVTFTPTVPGATSATLTLSTSDVAKPTIAVALSGTGVNPTAVVASTAAFGEQRVGATPAATLPLAVRNSGTGTLHITSAVLSGADSARYSVSPTTLDVPAGQSLNLTVTFTPTVPGATSATLTLSTSDVAKPTIAVALSGTGVNPTAVVASTLDFGERSVGATPAPTLPLAVRNSGTGTLHITSAVLSGTDSARYSVSPATLDVPAGQSLNLTVTFTPAAEGATSATLTLNTDDVAKPTVTVALSGTGVNPAATVASTVAFGEQRVGATPAATMALAVRNDGSGTLHITNAVLSGADSARYSVSPATLDVPSGQSLNLTVTFTPTVPGATSATLTLSTSDVAKPTIAVALSGTGVNPTALVASTLAFGEQSVGATPAP